MGILISDLSDSKKVIFLPLVTKLYPRIAYSLVISVRIGIFHPPSVSDIPVVRICILSIRISPSLDMVTDRWWVIGYCSLN